MLFASFASDSRCSLDSLHLQIFRKSFFSPFYLIHFPDCQKIHLSTNLKPVQNSARSLMHPHIALLHRECLRTFAWLISKTKSQGAFNHKCGKPTKATEICKDFWLNRRHILEYLEQFAQTIRRRHLLLPDNFLF